MCFHKFLAVVGQAHVFTCSAHGQQFKEALDLVILTMRSAKAFP